MKKVSFTEMKKGTKEDYLFLDKHEKDFASKTADRLLKFMSGLTETLEGYQISRLEHSLQSATRAYKNGESEEMIVAALFHDIGKPPSQCVNHVYNHKSYKGHGWMGQVIWTKVMNAFRLNNKEKCESYLSIDEQDLIGKGIGYHMCGLHRSDCECKLTQMLQTYLTILPVSVQNLLMVLN